MRRFVLVIGTALCLSTATMASGCYGSFGLAKKVHKWNGEVHDNKFVQWLVFLGLCIIPVYEISLVVDALVLNTIEFWTGDNPVGGVASMERAEDGSVLVTRGGETFRVVPETRTTAVVYREDGTRLGKAVVQADSSVAVYDDTGREVRRYSSAQLSGDVAPSPTEQALPERHY